jgi:hypothetical protein
MRSNGALLGFCVLAVALSGCTSKEEPAKQAIATIETNLSQVKADAAKYAPDALQAAEGKIARMKSQLADHKYTEVLAQAQPVNAEVVALHDAIVSKQTQEAAIAREWDELKEEIPKTIAAIQARVDGLRGAKLPKEVTKESYETAKTQLQSMRSMWAEAMTAFEAGKTTEAADKARQVQTTGKQVAEQLAMASA